MKRMLLVAGLAFLLIGCGATPVPTETPIPPTPTPLPCYLQATAYIESVQDIATEWDDANKLAANTARANLAPQIGVLQEIRRRTDELEYPPCSESPHALLVAYMDAQIDAFIMFMSETPGYTAAFTDAEKAFTAWSDEFAKLASGDAPYNK